MYFARGKRKLVADFKTKDLYDFYKEKYKERTLDKKTFLSIWKRFIDIRMQMIIYENLEFYLPHRLGSIMIKLGH